MTFQNISLLVALSAIGIPIALHLIARKEPRQVTFPSVRLLTQRFETNRSKVRIRRWWLLALRIAAVAVVALALARPAVAGSLSLTWSTIGILSLVGVGLLAMASVAASRPNQRTLMWSLAAAAIAALLGALGWGGYTLASGTKPEIDRSAPVALAVVVDNTPLTAWRAADDDHLSRLRDSAKQLILAASPESRIALIDRSSTPAAFALDLSGAISKADTLEPLEVVQPIESRIEAAARLLQTSDITSRQLVVLSNLSESSFARDATGQALNELAEQAGIRVTFWDMGGFTGVNRQLSIPSLSDTSPAPDTTVSVAAVLSLGDTPDVDGSPIDSVRTTAECVIFQSSPSLPVVRDGTILRPTAKAVDRVSAELKPGRDVELQMNLPPLPIGLHHGAIRLVGEDALSVDDAGYFTVSVLPPSRLLMISDNPDEAAEIAWSVSAPAPVNDPTSQYEIEHIDYDDLAASRLTDFDGVILLDPPQGAFSETEFERYVTSGGSVLVAVGNALGENRLEIPGWPTFIRRWRTTQPGTFFELSSVSHPALASLASTPGGVPFQDFRIHQYWQTESSANASSLIRYAGTDHVALWEIDGQPDTDFDGGRRLLVTTPIPALAPDSAAWNELFSSDDAWPAFALIRDLTRYLTGRNAENWTTSVGTPFSIPVSHRSGDDDQPQRLQWFPPVGSTPVPIDLPETDQLDLATSRVLIGQPKNSGVHWVRGMKQGLGFTVNLQRDTLSTTRIDDDVLDQVFGKDLIRKIESIDEMEWTATDGSEAVSLWSPMMLLALFVFLFEQVLSNRFYKRAPATQPGTEKRSAAA